MAVSFPQLSLLSPFTATLMELPREAGGANESSSALLGRKRARIL